jgi:di- and tripeptidase
MDGRNGYLYGRGVTDNKGPILAVACAVANLLSIRALGVDVVFLIEGEEECGSNGFGDAVRKHKVD